MSQSIRIVLVETSHPGNIGAVARAMKTMSLERLYLVCPRFFPHDDARARAAGADDILRNAVICETLAEAVNDTHLVVGASARLRSLNWPQLDPRECAELVREEAGTGEVALVFGRERSGLSNEELDLCQYLAHIPSNPDYGSLNLAAAVQVMCYELNMARITRLQPADEEAEPAADSAEVERFFAHLEQALVELEFLDPDNPRHLMRRLRRLFHRTRLSEKEVNILRGVLTAAQKRRSVT